MPYAPNHKCRHKLMLSISPSFPPSLPSSLPPSLPPLLTSPTSPTSLRSNPLGHRAPIQLNVGLCVWCWRAALGRSYCLAPSDVRLWHNGGIHSCRRRSYNAPLLHSAYVLPPRIRFFTNSKKIRDRHVHQTRHKHS